MFMDQFNYRVEFDDFAERHYIKKFKKKYQGKWLATEKIIRNICERIDNMLLHNRADLIYSIGIHKLVKLDFAIEGTQISPKASGNRCILFIDEDIRLVRVLLVYSKNEITSPHETEKWKKIIKDEYAEISDIFSDCI